MHIVVCVKHVVDSTEIHVDKKTNELVLRGLSTKINDYDKNAVEEAVKLKKELGATVSLISIGPRDAVKTLKEAVAMGADQAYLLQVSPRQQLDTAQVSLILSKMVEKLEPVDLILCGEVSEDGYNSQTGARLAARLGLPEVSYVTSLTAAEGSFEAVSTLEDTASRDGQGGDARAAHGEQRHQRAAPANRHPDHEGALRPHQAVEAQGPRSRGQRARDAVRHDARL